MICKETIIKIFLMDDSEYISYQYWIGVNPMPSTNQWQKIEVHVVFEASYCAHKNGRRNRSRDKTLCLPRVITTVVGLEYAPAGTSRWNFG